MFSIENLEHSFLNLLNLTKSFFIGLVLCNKLWCIIIGCFCLFLGVNLLNSYPQSLCGMDKTVENLTRISTKVPNT